MLRNFKEKECQPRAENQAIESTGSYFASQWGADILYYATLQESLHFIGMDIHLYKNIALLSWMFIFAENQARLNFVPRATVLWKILNAQIH